MNPFDPFNLLQLIGRGTMRYVTLALPTATVQNLIPPGLHLGPQSMTPQGTHPVLLGCHDMFQVRTSVPWLPLTMNYHEHTVNVPYCYVTQRGTHAGPYFFMPRLVLDSAWAVLGGRLWWGYAKDYGTIRNAGGCYSVADRAGTSLSSLSYEYAGEAKAVAQYPLFARQREVLSQLVISTVPLGVGSGFVLADFPKQWDVATLRPLSTVTEVLTDYVVGLPTGRYTSDGIDSSVTGAYELCAPFRLDTPSPLVVI